MFNLGRLIVVLGLMVCMFGCASHKVSKAPALSYDLYAQQQQVESNGVYLMARPIHEEADLKAYFDDDLIKLGILPVQLNLHNKDHDGNLSFGPESIVLYDQHESRRRQLNLNEIMDRAKKSYWRSAGWGVALGIIGAGVSAVNVSNANSKMEATYDSRIIKGGDLSRGNRTEGFVFFDVPKQLGSLNGWKLGLILQETDSQRMLEFEYGLAGTVLARKGSDDEEKSESADN